GRAVVEQHRQDLLEEQRVAVGRLDNCAARRGFRLDAAEEIPDQKLRLFDREWLQEHRRGVHLPTRPRRSELEQLGSSETDEHDRSVARTITEMFDEIEKRRLSPVEIVDNDDDGTLARKRLEQSTRGPERLFRRKRSVLEPHRSGKPLDDAFRFGISLEQLRNPRASHLRRRGAVDGGRSPHDPAQGPKRDSVPVGEALASQDGRFVADLCDQLVEKTRLADSGYPEDREEMTGPVGRRPLEGSAEGGELVLAVDQRRVEPPDEGRRPLDDREEPPRRNRLRFPLEREIFNRLDERRIADEPLGLGPDEDFTWCGGSLEAFRDVDCVSAYEGLGC